MQPILISYKIFSVVISNNNQLYIKHDRVWSHFLSPRRELKIPRVSQYFSGTSRCLEIWSNNVVNVWYFLSIETKTKKKMEN